MNFNTSRSIGNSSIVSRAKSQAATRYVTWAVVKVLLRATCATRAQRQRGF